MECQETVGVPPLVRPIPKSVLAMLTVAFVVLPPSVRPIPKGLHLSAQGWPDFERAYPGSMRLKSQPSKGCISKGFVCNPFRVQRSSRSKLSRLFV